MDDPGGAVVPTPLVPAADRGSGAALLWLQWLSVSLALPAGYALVALPMGREPHSPDTLIVVGLFTSAMQLLGRSLGLRPSLQRDEHLSAHTATFAQQRGQEPEPIIFDTMDPGRRGPAYWTWKGIVVPRNLQASLHPDQLAFIIARLFRPAGHASKRAFLVRSAAFLFTLGVATATTHWTAAVLLVGAIATIPFTLRGSRKREVEADLRALDLTRNLEAALSSLDLLHNLKWGSASGPGELARRRDALVEHWSEESAQKT